MHTGFHFNAETETITSHIKTREIYVYNLSRLLPEAQ